MLRIRHVATGKRRGPGCQFGLKGTSLGVKGKPFLSTKLNKKPADYKLQLTYLFNGFQNI